MVQWYGTTKGKTLWREGKEKSLDELRARVRLSVCLLPGTKKAMELGKEG
jgi:hypothetical protein